MSTEETSLEYKLYQMGLEPILFKDFYDFENLKIVLIELLHSVGIPQESIVLSPSQNIQSGQLSAYRKKSQFSTQPTIYLDLLAHFQMIAQRKDYSEFKVQELLKFSMLYAYGQSIFEYFDSEQFQFLYRENPYIVNHICRIKDSTFPTANVMGTFFANYVLGKNKNVAKAELMKICIEKYTNLNFSAELIDMAKLPRYDRIFRQDVDNLCSSIPLSLTPLEAMKNNSKIVLEVAQTLIRNHHHYNIKIIRGEGFNGKKEDFPQELLDMGITPFLFSHKAVLCDNINIIDFCALAYGQESCIIAGPKYKWRSLWKDISISKELPKKQEELQNFDFEFNLYKDKNEHN